MRDVLQLTGVFLFHLRICSVTKVPLISRPSDDDAGGQYAAVMRQYDLNLRDYAQVSGGFSGADVIRVETDDDRTWALRFVPRHLALPLPRIRRLHQLLQEVRQLGITAIPVPMADLNGQTVRPSPFGYWQLEPWQSGIPLTGSQLLPEHIRNAVAVLTQFHDAAAASLSDSPPNEWFMNTVNVSPAVRRRVQLVCSLRNGGLGQLIAAVGNEPDVEFRELARTVCGVLSSRLAALEVQLRRVSETLFVLQPVFRDLWSSHLLFCETQVTGLIDTSACGTDHVLTDLTRLQRSWYGADNSGVLKLAACFEKTRPLSVSEHLLLRALDESSVMLSPVTWLKRRFESRETANAGGGMSGGGLDGEICPPAVVARLRQLTTTMVDFKPL
jgi:hypothetical protein